MEAWERQIPVAAAFRHYSACGLSMLHAMSIDKDSSGIPEVDVHKRTTKVNLSIIIGVAIFLAVMSGMAVVLWLTNR